MKGLKIGFLAALLSALLIPLAAFRWGREIVSEIDNRMLQENPFSPEELEKGGDLSRKLENFVRDRIGFRDEMITGFTVLNDKLFGKMVHPSYCYGKEGYVFRKIVPPVKYNSFHETFADMAERIQAYCEDRGVPFLFVFDPSKSTVLQQYLPAGVRDDTRWIDTFLQALEERGVRYVDNRTVLQARADAGEMVFNRQYDAGHWNDLGAFYGVNTILEAMQRDFPCVHVNTMAEIQVSEELQSSLPVSKFPIHEMTPLYVFPDLEYEDRTEIYYGELLRDKSYRGFGYFVNSARTAEGAPRTLVFQGSYMNGRGKKFLQNSLGEYIFVHNYQNVIDFDYYFNVFKPEYVIFEVTEYAMTSSYFDPEQMAATTLNPVLDDVRAEVGAAAALPLQNVHVQQGTALTAISWTGGTGEESHVWAELGEMEFDLCRHRSENWEVTVNNEIWNRYGEDLRITALAGESLQEYR